MNKIFKSLLVSVFALFLFTGSSFAATSVRLQSPSANTNNTSLSLTFVALDTDSSQAVTVKCFKTGPNDSGSYSQFGGDFVTSAGGNTSTCNANLDEGNGAYSFYATAQGTSPATSSTVSTNFNNSKPGTPQYIGKDKISACVNRIKFKTADDGGKTVKVEIYRADKTTFDVNDGSKLGTVTVGSNEYREYDDTLSSCDTVFYYALRAFDAFGNPSDVVGDSNVTFNVTNPTVVTQQGAIPVSSNGTSGNGSVLGEGTSKGNGGSVLGTESAEPKTTSPEKANTEASQNPVANGVNWISSNKAISLVGFVVLLAIAYYLFRRNRNK